MKINKGTIVYHYTKGKGYVLDIKEKRGGDHLIICDFPSKGCEFITRKALVSGEAEIALKPHKRKMQGDDPIHSLLDGLFKGL